MTPGLIGRRTGWGGACRPSLLARMLLLTLNQLVKPRLLLSCQHFPEFSSSPLQFIPHLGPGAFLAFFDDLVHPLALFGAQVQISLRPPKEFNAHANRGKGLVAAGIL